MSEFINNEDMMRTSGKNYLAELSKVEEENFNNLSNVDGIDKVIEGSDVATVSKDARKAYKKMVDESDGAGEANRTGSIFGRVEDYLNARKYANTINRSTEVALNKNYKMPLDEKGLKKLKGRMEDAKKTTELFDKIHNATKKYGLWMFLLCLLVPFAIPAMLAVASVVALEYVTHEAVCQYEYRQVIKPLTVNGKNPYKNMLYGKGYKELEKLTAKKMTPEDVVKSLVEAKENEKDPKRKEELDKVLAKYLEDNQAKAEAQKAEQSAETKSNEPPQPTSNNGETFGSVEEEAQTAESVGGGAENVGGEEENVGNNTEQEQPQASDAEQTQEEGRTFNPNQTETEIVTQTEEQGLAGTSQETVTQQINIDGVGFVDTSNATVSVESTETGDDNNSVGGESVTIHYQSAGDTATITQDTLVPEDVAKTAQEGTAEEEAEQTQSEEQVADFTDVNSGGETITQESAETGDSTNATSEESGAIDYQSTGDDTVTMQEENPQNGDDGSNGNSDTSAEVEEAPETAQQEEQPITQDNTAEPEHVEGEEKEQPLVNGKKVETIESVTKSFREKTAIGYELIYSRDFIGNENFTTQDYYTFGKLEHIFNAFVEKGDLVVASTINLITHTIVDRMPTEKTVGNAIDPRVAHSVEQIFQIMYGKKYGGLCPNTVDNSTCYINTVENFKASAMYEEQIKNTFNIAFVLTGEALQNNLAKDGTKANKQDLETMQAIRGSFDHCLQTKCIGLYDSFAQIMASAAQQSTTLEVGKKLFDNEMGRCVELISKNVDNIGKNATNNQNLTLENLIKEGRAM